MSDLIDRQAAVKAVYWDADAISAIESLPSGQPEIINCCYCEYRAGQYCHNKNSYGAFIRYDHFCGYAVRREVDDERLD